MTIPPDAHLHKPDINGTTVLLLKLSELSLCLIFRLSIERKPRNAKRPRPRTYRAITSP